MGAGRGCTVRDLMRDDYLRKGIRLDQYITDATGLPTLTDVMNELAKPGRDPREQFEIFAFTEGVSKLEDLKPGLRLSRIVTNLPPFAPFIPTRIPQHAFLHIPQPTTNF